MCSPLGRGQGWVPPLNKNLKCSAAVLSPAKSRPQGIGATILLKMFTIFLLKNRLGRQAWGVIDSCLEDVFVMIKRLWIKPARGADKSE